MTGQPRPGSASDAVLAALYAHPFKVHHPVEQRVPFVFASPHSGRLYPRSFVAGSRLDPLALRRSEDAYVDVLFDGAIALGAPMIAARFPRVFLDVNRAATELDPVMFEGTLNLRVDVANARVNAGLGVVPRIVRDGAEIYGRKLAPHEAEERIAVLHVPYHAAVARLIDSTLRRFGVAILIDCHSMPSAATVPDIVLGDRFGMSASPLVTRLAESAFERIGFSVVRNTPYAGGHTTHLYGQRENGVHALQIEINRALYLDERLIELNSDFPRIQERLAAALAELTKINLEELGRGKALPLAAE